MICPPPLFPPPLAQPADVVAQLRDGRTVLIEVKPIYEVGYAVNQDKFDAGRVYESAALTN
ncbi:hypothetical protein MSP7336_02979 [Mycobacterium shimoidei]|uniref:Uncharacterized protein n=1 Tax=Mycobacterium shimoidei TaxID=29313 RepID=A0A375Z0R9_MYCSH|nr:hypothetical protein [Mycobacterium shimoidei]SRX94719.1 hypothetical protein MSP7336_02979 [Mycobacterium shimoidei]